jgi:putative ABC transport system permease protein
VGRSRLNARDACWEAVSGVTGAPRRCLLTCLGIVLGVAAVIATIGMADSARGAVSGTFDAAGSTEVIFSGSELPPGSRALSEASEKVLGHLHGVSSVGLMWALDGGQALHVRRTAAPSPTGTVSLPVTVATPGALATMGADVSSGRLYDAGMERRHDPVALLGAAAASQLGISQADRSPIIYVGSMQLTVIGIVARTTMTSEALASVIVPPSLASDIADPGGSRQLIVRTAPGAAQLIARQGPYAIDPMHPGQIDAGAPPSPDLLRNQVRSSLTSLILALALLTVAVGAVVIAAATLLSVIERTAEIGLRRATGAARRHIAALILGEAAVTGTVGGITGASAGVLIVAAVAAARGWSPVLDPAVIATAPLLGTLAGLLAGAYPAWRASRISPGAALQR